MAWNLKTCTSPNLLKKNCPKNRREKGLGMISPQLSPFFPDGESPAKGGGAAKRLLTSAVDQRDEELAEDHLDDTSQPAEKKRRLTRDQVNILERSFQLENKLEPVRKSAIAKQLGLQPRQVAVWFQNRRARWKTKQLESDFDALKKEYNAILEENEKLQSEVARLTAQLTPTSKGEKESESEKARNDLHHRKVALQIKPPNVDKLFVVDKIEVVSSESGKSDLGSPTKSDLSEVLDTGSYNPRAMTNGCEPKAGDVSLCHVVKTAELPVTAAEEQSTFVNICNPYLIQQLAVKLEPALYHDDTYGFLFSWDDQFTLPLYDD